MAHPGRPRKCDPRVNRIHQNIKYDEIVTAKLTLEEFGIDATDGAGRTALIHAVAENKPIFIQWLLDNGANINHQDRTGYSVLHFSGQNRLVDLTGFLLDNGADPNLQDIHGNTPLWTAVFQARLQTPELRMVKLLLKHGANPDIINQFNNTPRNLYKTINETDISAIDIA